MPLAKHALEARLAEAFPHADITVVDTAGDADHYAVTVACASFAGMSKLAQHRAVQAAVPELGSGQLHAMSVTTKIPASL